MPEPGLTTFAAIRGHERACAFLRAAVANQRLAHALLFAGPDGIGKRAVAGALAAWLECTAGGDDACGTCASCRQAAAGSHPDLQIIAVAAGKKEIGVDRVRELKRFTQLQPLGGTMKIGIVDDAHMLTVAAQNALLKTLEEPPPRSLLILVANNPDALLPTVRSRCQRVQFAPLPTAVVVELLTTQHGVDAATARDLAALAEGSPGRALALSRSFVGGRRQQLLEALATLGTARYVQLAQMAQELSHPEAEATVKLETLLHACRDDALRAVGAAPPPSRRLRGALRRADVVADAWNALRRGSPNRQLLLEALLLRLART